MPQHERLTNPLLERIRGVLKTVAHVCNVYQVDPILGATAIAGDRDMRLSAFVAEAVDEVEMADRGITKRGSGRVCPLPANMSATELAAENDRLRREVAILQALVQGYEQSQNNLNDRIKNMSLLMDLQQVMRERI